MQRLRGWHLVVALGLLLPSVLPGTAFGDDNAKKPPKGSPDASASAPPPPAATVEIPLDPHDLAVLGFDSKGADEQADALTLALRAQVRGSPDWHLVEGDRAPSLPLLVAGLHCPDVPDGPCLEKISHQIHVERYFWGKVDKGAGTMVDAEVHLRLPGAPDRVKKASFSENLKDGNDEALKRVAADLYETLTVGLVKSSAAPPPAHVEKPPSKSLLTTKQWVGIGITGVGVVAGVIGIVGAAGYFAAKSDLDSARQMVHANPSLSGTRQGLCRFDASGNPTTGGAELAGCNDFTKAKTASTMGWIGGGAAIILVAAGIYTIGTGSTTKESALVVVPAVGPHEQGVAASLRF